MIVEENMAVGFILHARGTDRHLIESHGRHVKVK